LARFSSPAPGLEPGAAGLLSAARGLGAPAAASPPPASAQTCGRPDWALQAGLGVALRAPARAPAPAPPCASAASAPAGGWAGEPGWAAAVAAVRAGGRRARAQALAEAHSGVYPTPPALGAPLESYSLADMQRAFGLGRAAEHSDRRSSCGSPSPGAVAAVQCRGAPGDPDAAFAALTAGGPRQTLPCAAASPFYALLGKAALPPEPELSAAGAWGADGRLCAGRAHGGLWAGPAPGADLAGCAGDLGLGLRLDPDAPAAEVLAGCASFQAHVLARPAAFCETGMPSTGSTESDGTFVGPALGLAGLPGYDLAPVRAASRRGPLVGVREERRRGTGEHTVTCISRGWWQALVLVALWRSKGRQCHCNEGHDGVLFSVCLCWSGGPTGWQAGRRPSVELMLGPVETGVVMLAVWMSWRWAQVAAARARQVHSTSAAGCYARFAGALRPAPACERALPGQHWLPGEPEYDFTSLH